MDKEQKPEQQKTNLILRIVGGVITAAGLLMAIFGFVDIASVSESGEMPRIWLLMVGLPGIAIGGMLLMLSFRRVGSGNVVNSPGGHISPAAVNPSAPRQRAAVVCPFCGEAIDADAQFCDKCGKPLCKFCPDCGEANSLDACFCKKCGKPLSDDAQDHPQF